jgi:thioredoxin 1
MEAKKLTFADFDKTLKSAKTPVIVDFWASYCTPCKLYGPKVDQLATEYDGKLIVAKVETTQNKELAHKYGIDRIPTTVVFVDGKEVMRKSGNMNYEALKAIADQYLPKTKKKK